MSKLDKNKVLVALSGGVDSAAAAVLLKQQGYQVVGVFICLGHSTVAYSGQGKSCCSPQDAADAQRIAVSLGVDFHVFDAAETMAQIKDFFCLQYQAGKTPNPCILCNEWIKFGKLFDLADQLGIFWVATGHYADVRRLPDASVGLFRAKAYHKDQSYALFSIPVSRFERIILPLGQISDKTDTRNIVYQAGLPVFDKPESQEICFVSDGDYAKVLAGKADRALQPGPIKDLDGTVIGQHPGYGLFTIGQRKGIRIAAKYPLYVKSIDATDCSITVGPRQALFQKGLKATKANWLAAMPNTFACRIQIRYNDRGADGVVQRVGDHDFHVIFDNPVFAITPGQAAVLYQADRVIGGGWIEQAFD